MKPEKFSIRKRLKSFTYAFSGLKMLFRDEHNAFIHLVVVVIVSALGIYLNISWFEWYAVILCFGLVIGLEAMNTAIENLADFRSPEKNESIKRVKDIASAGVLIAAIASFIIGLMIFLPKIMELME